MDFLFALLQWLSVPQHAYGLCFAASLSVYVVLAVKRGIRQSAAALAAEAAALDVETTTEYRSETAVSDRSNADTEMPASQLPKAGPAEPA
jgi:hypothetical protein